MPFAASCRSTAECNTPGSVPQCCCSGVCTPQQGGSCDFTCTNANCKKAGGPTCNCIKDCKVRRRAAHCAVNVLCACVCFFPVPGVRSAKPQPHAAVHTCRVILATVLAATLAPPMASAAVHTHVISRTKTVVSVAATLVGDRKTALETWGGLA
jgi:hypothetical protein